MRAVTLASFIAMAAGSVLAAGEYSYADLLAMQTDLERLAVLPQPGERCAQFSSYDRRSRYDGATGTYVNWSANGDASGMVRREDDGWVMAEMDGPGCIWRIWSARPGNGHVKIYLDGAGEPAVDMPFRHYFDGEHEPFTQPEFVYTAAQGRNCYVPIPYQRSCKVVAEEGWGDYYHITYGTFPEGTEVVSGLPVEGRSPDLPPRGYGEVVPGYLALEPGETAVVADLPGPRAITALSVSMSPGETDAAGDVLREVALQITWDGESSPAVWAPLGDFFGTVPGLNAYRSLPMGVSIPELPADGAGPDPLLWSAWYMPFERRALVEVVNNSRNPQTLAVAVVHAPLDRPIAGLGRFHAKWHRDAFLPEEPGRAIDWTLLKTKGRGRYVGTMLHVWNPRGGWWGEGDEKFFVDGGRFPSTFGTGSEDYFGYAWCDPTLFSRPFHAQTHNDGWNRGHVSVLRWHIADNVPFQESFEACIEKYLPNTRGTLYAATAYWYLEPGGEDPYGPVPVEERVGYAVPAEPFNEEGALEGEALEVLRRDGGQLMVQDMYPFGEGWSGDKHLWWIYGRPGDELVLALPVEEAGTYDITAQFTKARDYGIVSLRLDGDLLGAPIDLYSPAVVRSGPVQLGRRELAAGTHELTVRIEGANEAAVKSRMFGLDWVKLTAAD